MGSRLHGRGNTDNTLTCTEYLSRRKETKGLTLLGLAVDRTSVSSRCRMDIKLVVHIERQLSMTP